LGVRTVTRRGRQFSKRVKLSEKKEWTLRGEGERIENLAFRPRARTASRNLGPVITPKGNVGGGEGREGSRTQGIGGKGRARGRGKRRTEGQKA